MIRYSCAIGTTGTLTPASAPISPREHPARVDDDLRLDVALVGLDAGDAAALDARSPVTRVFVRDLGAARGARPRRARRSAGSGRCSRRSGGRPRPARRRSTSAGRAPAPRSAETSSSGSPNVFAQPACRAISSMPLLRRGEPERADLAPARLEPDLSARASGRGRRSSSSSSSALSEPRSWPTRPAEWKVEPLVRSARSTRRTSSQPSRASQ